MKLFQRSAVLIEPDNGYATAGNTLLKTCSLLSWVAIWCYLESQSIERERQHVRAQADADAAAAAAVPWEELLHDAEAPGA